ncbi:universal stress protein [Terrimonas sp. NA20]|uniref:Universal stress protein n=1 Tax=Terrimonas ginsenosidimutans TaxID=2908004 RepID=A0ABS9KVD8_9BACT|nr:universal stress protein [Terrimonas ginsenosidimutans]MCG2616275.1 universal stress protein [Terrimonas ginsenosidimutans]
MKKILLAFDGTHYSQAALEFAYLIHQKDHIFLTGAFLPQVDYSSLWSYATTEREGRVVAPLLEDSTAEEVQQNILRFTDYCQQRGIPCKTHTTYLDFAMPELKKESRFADLLIVSSQEFYKQAGSEVSNYYLKEILHELECPLIVIPEKSIAPSTNILAYDGSASSMYAIKQFAYLFPAWANNPTTIVYATPQAGREWPYDTEIREFIESHFKNVNWQRLVIPNRNFFSSWLMENNDAILVSGSFGRSGLSMLFRKSFIAEAINEHYMPVFIAHQ